MHTFSLLTTLFTALFLSGVAHAQGVGVIRVTPRGDLPLAAPTPTLPTGNGQAEATAAWETMWFDLGASGYFKMQNPSGYLEKGKGAAPGTFDFAAWEQLGTAVLVKTRLFGAGSPDCDRNGPRICADVYIYDVSLKQSLSSKRFRVAPDAARYLGHAIANHVLEIVTGTRGWFGSRLVAVNAASGNKEIFVLETDGKGQQPVTRNGDINLSPAWSPDGASIAWTSYKRGNPDLFVKSLLSGRTRTLSAVDGVNTSPTFSPDGQHVAMTRTVEGDSDIFVLDAKSGDVIQRVTRGGGIDVSPSYSPDGNLLAFASERGGGAQIYVKPTNGSAKPKRITFQGDFNVDPVFSPDGKRVAFVGRSAGGFDIYVVDPNGRNLVRLTQDLGDNEDPTWSPDSRYLIFSSTRNGRSDLWMTTADGRHQVQITRSGSWTQPSWMPQRGT